jgi:multiple sugar transport system substrate-binding protein
VITTKTNHRKTSKAVLAGTALGLATVLTAAGCGSSGSSSSKGSSSKPVTLTITGDYGSSGFNTTVDWWKAAAVVFKKSHPNVTVKVKNIVTTSESTYYSKLDLLEHSSSTSPNITWEDSFLVKSDASAGYLSPLPTLKSFSEWKAQYPTFKAMTEFNGTPYSMMVESDVQQLYYDHSLLAKAGLPSTWKPASLNDILTAAEAVKAKDPGIIPFWIYTGTPLGEASSFRGFQVLLDGTSSALYDTKTDKWETGGPGFDQVFNFLAALHQKGLEEPTADWSNPSAGTVLNTQLMPAQKVAIALDGSWVSTEWLKSGPKPWAAGFKTYGVTDVPTYSGQAPGVTNLSGGWSLAVPSKSNNKALAQAFIETATSPSLLSHSDGITGQIPVESNVASSPSFKNLIKSDPLFQTAVTYAQHTNYRPGFGPYNQITADIAAITGNISLGQMSAAAAEKAYASDVTSAAGAKNVEK